MAEQTAEHAIPYIEESHVKSGAKKTVYSVLFAISFAHLLNDLLQSLLPAIYPLLKDSFGLDFKQIGLLTLTNQLTASLLQPLVGYYTDRHPKPFSLATGMGFTLVGLILLSTATSFYALLSAAALVGIGSSVFHPESSRVARMASGGKYGLAQSVFQVGGNFGASIGPLLAAFIVIPRGQGSISWFAICAVVAIALLWRIGIWYANVGLGNLIKDTSSHITGVTLSTRQVNRAIVILVVLIFSKYFYLASLTSYYTFYLMDKFQISVQSSQIYLFIFLGSVAAGTLIGGPIGDRVGRKTVIWASIVGALPFTLLLPYASLYTTAILSALIGLILASAFSAILVYAQELMPGRVGMISGLFFGIAFGMGGIGAAVLGWLADYTSITFVYKVCAYLPAIGLLTILLPETEKKKWGRLREKEK